MRVFITLLLSVALVSGCGYRLRGSSSAFNQEVVSISLKPIDDFAWSKQVTRALNDNNIITMPNTDVSLTVVPIRLSKQALVFDGNMRAQELRLTAHLDFEINGESNSITTNRVLNNRLDKLTSTEREAEALEREMQMELLQRLSQIVVQKSQVKETEAEEVAE